MRNQLFTSTALAAAIGAASCPAWAHHGFGLFQLDIQREWTGTLTKMNLINPHSYMELEVTKDDGTIQHMRWVF
jgi:hypothetical protein